MSVQSFASWLHSSKEYFWAANVPGCAPLSCLSACKLQNLIWRFSEAPSKTVTKEEKPTLSQRGRGKTISFFGRLPLYRDYLIFAQCLPKAVSFLLRLKYFVLLANFAVSACFSHCRETNGWATDQRLQERAVFQLKAETQEYVQAIISSFFYNTSRIKDSKKLKRETLVSKFLPPLKEKCKIIEAGRRRATWQRVRGDGDGARTDSRTRGVFTLSDKSE